MRRLFWVLFTATVYYAAARLGLLLAFEGTNASPVWPPSGIALALLLLLGERVWPGILLGAFSSNLRVFLENDAAPAMVLVAVSAAIATGNTLEGLAARKLLRRLNGADTSFTRLHTLPKFLLAALPSCLVAATIGTSSLAAAGLTARVPDGMVWLTWWLGDLVGMLVFAPLILTWAAGPLRLPSWSRALEALLLVAAIPVAGAIGFGLRGAAADPRFPLAFLVMPPLVWAAIRFGPQGASVSVFAVAVMATWGAVGGPVPPGSGGFHASLLLAQAYVGVLALTHLALAAAVAELRSAKQLLTEAASTLEQRVADRTALAEQRAEQLRNLAGELFQTEHRERRQLSRILHDHVQQLLAAAQLQVARMTRSREAPPEHARAADTAASLVSESIAALRDLSVRLSPPILHDQGLDAGLHWLSRDMKAKHGLAVQVIDDGACAGLDEPTTLMAFEAARELLFNVSKHSGSQQATVRVACGNGMLRVCVEDAGRGFDCEAIQRGAPGGLGLFSLSERVRALRGRVEIESRPGEGTRVMLSIPCRTERTTVGEDP
jgi:signal transduction histidine kinase